MINERMYDLIRVPVITEKSSYVAEQDKIVVKVDIKANKGQIKRAVEKLFNVKVTAVNTLVVKGKVKRFKGTIGKRASYKKAIVTLQKGQAIDIMSGV